MALVFLDFQIRFDSVNQGGLGFVLILQDAENPLVNGAGGNNVLNHNGISLLPLAVAIISAATMGVFMRLRKMKGAEWLDSFSVAGSMLVAMISAIFLGKIL